MKLFSRSSQFLCQTAQPFQKGAFSGNRTQIIRHRKKPLARIVLGRTSNSVTPTLGELNNIHNEHSYVAVSQSGFFSVVAHENAQKHTIFREAR